MFKMRKKYDLIFSLGAACSCTQTLRATKLQDASYPFDWLYGSDFSKRIDILLSEFDRYIEKDDLSFLHQTNGAINNPCTVYKNNYNQIVFNHDFSQGVDFDKMYPLVKEKYNRRIKRLLNNVKSSKNVLIAYIQTPTNTEKIDNKILTDALEKLKKKYTEKNIDIIYFMCDKSLKIENKIIEKINKNITKVTANYASTNLNDPPYAVNEKLLNTFFKNKYALNKPFAYKIKKTFLMLKSNVLLL